MCRCKTWVSQDLGALLLTFSRSVLWRLLCLWLSFSCFFRFFFSLWGLQQNHRRVNSSWLFIYCLLIWLPMSKQNSNRKLYKNVDDKKRVCRPFFPPWLVLLYFMLGSAFDSIPKLSFTHPYSFSVFSFFFVITFTLWARRQQVCNLLKLVPCGNQSLYY